MNQQSSNKNVLNDSVKGNEIPNKRLISIFLSVTITILFSFFIELDADKIAISLFLNYLGIWMIVNLLEIFGISNNKEIAGCLVAMLTLILALILGHWPTAILVAGISGVFTLMLIHFKKTPKKLMVWAVFSLMFIDIAKSNVYVGLTPSFSRLFYFITLCFIIFAIVLEKKGLHLQTKVVPKKERTIEGELHKILSAHNGDLENSMDNKISKERVLTNTSKSLLININYPDFQEQVDQLSSLEKEIYSLPEAISNISVEIIHKGIAILKCMNEDSRDVLSGKQFLNRYLPIVTNILVRYRSIFIHTKEHFATEELDQQTHDSLKTMSDIFTQMHKKLLQNDIDDLEIELKMIDTLAKSQGFKIE